VGGWLPIAPIDGARPASRTFLLKVHEVNCNPAIGMDDQLVVGVAPSGWHSDGVED